MTATGSEVVTHVGELVTQHEEHGTLRDAAVVLEGGRVVWLGPASSAPPADRCTDVGGRAVLPGWVDSHTHLVFDGDRSAEFEARMAGRAYEAGGIAVTTRATRSASDDRLRRLVSARVDAALAGGTTCLETKTGYGLTVADEARSAAIAADLVDEVTFLGAHLVPEGMDVAAYTDLVCGPMLDAVGPFVRWADVFCDEGAFDPESAARVLRAARDAGLGLRVHGNQLRPGPGVRLAVESGAASVDHCNHLTAADIDLLSSAAGSTVATVLPACDLSTRAPFAPARGLIDAGATVAIASNCNPGTSYTSSMSFCVATAVLQMGLSIDEAVRAATVGGAAALHRDRGDGPDGLGPVGSIGVGHRADLHVLDAPSAIHLAYQPGMPLTWGVWRAGVRAA